VASWEEFERVRPDLAAVARSLFQIEHPEAPVAAGLGYLATVRASDGGPRVHPISPAVVDGHFYGFIVRTSPKLRDLRSDPRYALHSWPREFTDDGFNDEELYITGRARPVSDERLTVAVAKAVGDPPESGEVFELEIEHVMHKSRPEGKLTYEKWAARVA
jgi:nitroimidazol reductase NimA-like FMN-containing flavoprotein (pyridoxamine 5'-phosphate oxidase superfamily)